MRICRCFRRIKVDFLRDDTASLIANAADAADLVGRLSLLAGHKIDKSKTLIFLDEVQEAKNLVTLSKYLVEEGGFRLARLIVPPPSF